MCSFFHKFFVHNQFINLCCTIGRYLSKNENKYAPSVPCWVVVGFTVNGFIVVFQMQNKTPINYNTPVLIAICSIVVVLIMRYNETRFNQPKNQLFHQKI